MLCCFAVNYVLTSCWYLKYPCIFKVYSVYFSISLYVLMCSAGEVVHRDDRRWKGVQHGQQAVRERHQRAGAAVRHWWCHRGEPIICRHFTITRISNQPHMIFICYWSLFALVQFVEKWRASFEDCCLFSAHFKARLVSAYTKELATYQHSLSSHLYFPASLKYPLYPNTHTETSVW